MARWRIFPPPIRIYRCDEDIHEKANPSRGGDAKPRASSLRPLPRGARGGRGGRATERGDAVHPI